VREKSETCDSSLPARLSCPPAMDGCAGTRKFDCTPSCPVASTSSILPRSRGRARHSGGPPLRSGLSGAAASKVEHGRAARARGRSDDRPLTHVPMQYIRLDLSITTFTLSRVSPSSLPGNRNKSSEVEISQSELSLSNVR
jgi:hypothetical protein